jgi:hypothetical protein
MFVGKGGKGGAVGVGQGLWPSVVAPHEDPPWGMIICVVQLQVLHNFQLPHSFSSVLYFTLALTGKTRFGWALATPSFHLPYYRT